MRALIQRVTAARVEPHESAAGSIADGLLVFLGVAKGDTEHDLAYLVEKISTLRIFEDENGKMNKSMLETNGSMLLVSQFTLLADCKKGNRPNFFGAAEPDLARAVYEKAIDAFRSKGISVESGVFGAHMRVTLENDGPVTILLDSREPKSV